MWEKQRGVYPTGVNSEQEGFQKAKVWLTVKGFEFGKYFPCSQELSGALSSVPLWYSSSSTHYFKDDVLQNFFFFFLPTTHCTWSISPTFGNSVPFYTHKSKIYSSNQDPFLKIQVCISYCLWNLHLNAAEVPQAQHVNLNSSSSSSHYPYSSILLYHFPSISSISLNDTVFPHCWTVSIYLVSHIQSVSKSS